MASVDALRDRLRNDPPPVLDFEVGDQIRAPLPSGRGWIQGTIKQTKELAVDGLCAYIDVCAEDKERFNEPNWSLWVTLQRSTLLARVRVSKNITFIVDVADFEADPASILKDWARQLYEEADFPEGSMLRVMEDDGSAWGVIMTPDKSTFACHADISARSIRVEVPYFGSPEWITGCNNG